ncbi:hypothetical protein DFS33DRAFT_1264717, partial [Desarmillaria ectypa]
ITYIDSSVDDLVTKVNFVMTLTAVQRSHVLFNAVGSPMNHILDRPRDGSLEVV